jgi:hypothetical protein
MAQLEKSESIEKIRLNKLLKTRDLINGEIIFTSKIALKMTTNFKSFLFYKARLASLYIDKIQFEMKILRLKLRLKINS